MTEREGRESQQEDNPAPGGGRAGYIISRQGIIIFLDTFATEGSKHDPQSREQELDALVGQLIEHVGGYSIVSASESGGGTFRGGPNEPGEAVTLDDQYFEEVRQAVGRGTPSVLLGTSTRSLNRSLAKIRAAERGEPPPHTLVDKIVDVAFVVLVAFFVLLTVLGLPYSTFVIFDFEFGFPRGVGAAAVVFCACAVGGYLGFRARSKRQKEKQEKKEYEKMRGR